MVHRILPHVMSPDQDPVEGTSDPSAILSVWVEGLSSARQCATALYVAVSNALIIVPLLTVLSMRMCSPQGPCKLTIVQNGSLIQDLSETSAALNE